MLPSRIRAAGRPLALFATLLAAGLLVGCSSSDDNPADAGSNRTIQVPPSDLMVPDLPASLAPGDASAAGAWPALRTDPPCDSEDGFGRFFACLTRHIFTSFAVEMVAGINDMMTVVADGLAEHEIPADAVIEITEDGQTIRFVWSVTDGGTHYDVDFSDATTHSATGSWDWTIGEDGGVSGEIRMLAALMDDGDSAPDGMAFEFESNADGSERSLSLDLDLPDTPPTDDPSAPTAFRMDAVRAGGLWTVRYGMYLPAWISELDGMPAGLPTVLLVNAVGEPGDAGRGMMHIVALDADLASVPADALTDSGVCDYIVDALVDAGGMQPGDYTCPPPNPFYVEADGDVQEGGTAPAGFSVLGAALDEVEFVVSNPGLLGELTVGL